MRLDGDAALALEVHGVEDLRLHLARLERAGQLEEAVRQRRLAVIDVGDDREITDVARVHRIALGADEVKGPVPRRHVSAIARSSGTNVLRIRGPVYSARGRISRLFAYCSSTCAVQPEMRLTAKIGVNRSIGMPSA